MFPKDWGKWCFLAGLYQHTLEGMARMGQMISRKDFLDRAILVQLGAEDIAELLAAGKRVQFVQMTVPPPARAMRQPIQVRGR